MIYNNNYSICNFIFEFKKFIIFVQNILKFNNFIFNSFKGLNLTGHLHFDIITHYIKEINKIILNSK